MLFSNCMPSSSLRVLRQKDVAISRIRATGLAICFSVCSYVSVRLLRYARNDSPNGVAKQSPLDILWAGGPNALHNLILGNNGKNLTSGYSLR
jgi:hypothetical protein